MARHHGTCHPFFFFFPFFSSTKTKTDKKTCRQSSLIEKSWMTSTNWSVWQRPLPSRILSSFFFSFFFLTLSHTHTHTLVKFVVDRFSPSPTMQLTSRKQHLLQYVHTRFFCSTISKRSKAKKKNDSHPKIEREKKNRFKKKKKIQIFVPCYNPPQMEKGLTLNTKISQFLYIKLPLLALVQEYTHFSRELVCWENLYF